MDIPIYRWSGEHFGFIINGRLFDKKSKYLGWIDGNEVWEASGHYLGEITNTNYILKRQSMANKAVKAVRATPATPAIRATRSTKAGRAIRSGYIDALDQFA